MDSLSLKASEIYSLQTEAAFNIEEKILEIAKKSILEGLDNELISKITDFTIEKIETLRTKYNF